MSGDINISYTYNVGGTEAASVGQPAKAAEADQKLYAFEDCTVVRLPTGGKLLVHRYKSTQTAVSDDVAVALEHCGRFRTLQGHAEYLTAYMPELGGDVAGVRRVLEQMRDAGVLTGSEELAAQFATAAASEPTPAPSRAFIYTCDRPEALGRLLETLPADADLSVHERVCVVDDSRRADSAAGNRELVQAFNSRNGASVGYFGLEEREELIQGLAAALPGHEEEIRFLLDQQRWRGHKTYGCPRSLVQLLSVGRRAVMMDDDILCRTYESPGAEPGVEFVESVGEAIFYPSDDAWLASSTRRKEDPLAGHLRCLGLGVRGVLKELGLGSLDAARLAGSEASQLRGLNDNSRVLLTQCGTFGDPGTPDLSWVLLLQGQSLKRLLQAPEGVEAALRNLTCWLGRTRPTLSRHGNMSGVTGLDNTTLLPPYIPAGRGEDAFFAYMLEFLYPDSLVLDYPWAVPHLPVEERVGDFSWQGDKGDFSILWNHIRNNVANDSAYPLQNRIDSLVQLMRDVGERSDASLAAAYRADLAAQQAAAARQVMDQLRTMPVANAEWRKLLEMRRHEILQALGRRELPLVARGYEKLTEPELLANVRKLVRGFANALEVWPQMREAARELVG